jgi:hypothetical protein
MRYLLITSPATWPLLELEIELGLRLIEQGHIVHVLNCDGTHALQCEANNPEITKGISQSICEFCKAKRVAANKILLKSSHSSNLYFHTLSDFIYSETLATVNSAVQVIKQMSDCKISTKEIANSYYKGLHESARSMLMSALRSPVIDDISHAPRYYEYLYEGIIYLEAFKSLTKIFSPDEVFIFNGRIPRYASIYSYLQDTATICNVYEYPFYGYNNFLVFKNYRPHELSQLAKDLKEKSEDSPLNPEKIIIAYKWIIQRRSRERIEHVIPFAKNQILKLLPPDWDTSVYNIVVFPSSQDELEIITGKDDVIMSMTDILKTLLGLSFKFNLTIRFHPNQVRDCESLGIIQDFIKDKEYSQKGESKIIHVVNPDSPIDSYALVDAADLVIVQSSTIGLEAAAVGKIVVRTGPSFYMYSDCTINATCVEDLKQIILNALLDKLDVDACRSANNAIRLIASYLQFGVACKHLYRNKWKGGTIRLDGKTFRARVYNPIIIITLLFNKVKCKILNIVHRL